MIEIDLDKETILSLQSKMADGTLSARALVQYCLDRIEKYEPRLNAVLECNPDALKIADALDRERAEGKLRGPLHGIPILVKDNFDTGDQMMTTAGSLALVGPPAPQDAFAVKQLRNAGAVILGKTNLSEWSNYRSTRSSSGWSSRGGQTRNAYDQRRSPGGSSSGSAVAVAAGYCVAALGTETDGSVTSPAAMSSLVGIKPSVGMVSRAGIIPVSSSQDTAGVLARNVQDATLVYAAISGHDPQDQSTQAANEIDFSSAFDSLDKARKSLNIVRIGVARNYAGFHEGADRLLDQAVRDLTNAGARVVDNLNLAPVEAMRPFEAKVMAYEFKSTMNAYLASRAPQASIKSVADILAFNLANADDVLPWFQQELLERAEATDGLDNPDYIDAVQQCRLLSRDNGIDLLIDTHDLDAIIAPTTCTPWLIDFVNGDNRSGGSAAPAAIAGYPNVTVPMGYVHGLPMGLSFFAKGFQDRALLDIVVVYEAVTKHRRAPNLDL